MFKVIIYLLLGIILSLYLYLSLNGINSLSLSLLYIYIYFSLTHSLTHSLSLCLSLSLSLSSPSTSLSLSLALSFSGYINYSIPVSAENYNSNKKLKRWKKIKVFYYDYSLSQVERVDLIKRRRGRRGTNFKIKNTSFYATPSSPPSSPLPPPKRRRRRRTPPPPPSSPPSSPGKTIPKDVEPSGSTNENVKVYRIVYYLLFFFKCYI